MRILLVSLNAKYIHTNLAIRYLREVLRPEFPDTSIKEFTINQQLAQIAADLFEAKADVIGFSCYIWNMNETVALIRRLSRVCPNTRFVLGGPEVSFNPEDILRDNQEVDAIVSGEGEETFLELLRTWEKGLNLSGVLGVAWRQEQEVLANSARPVRELGALPDPYLAEEPFEGRLAYVETTRGCPFSCQYCLSSTTHGVRFLPPERFRESFRRLLRQGAKTIKFVDRTFNVEKRHAFAILDIVREEVQELPEPGSIRVHCEMAGELLDEAWLEYLRNYPAGLLQFEIGVQSTHQPTLSIIQRAQDFQTWQARVEEIQTYCGIPIHLDLIAGLPEENWETFQTSFNEVFAVQPDMLQLGFLKVLKGSGLRRDSEAYGLVYLPDPPYTILQTNVLSHSELLRLERMEEVLNQYYNSGKFVYSLRYILKSGAFDTPFDFFAALAAFWHTQGWFVQPVHGKALFQRLWSFLLEKAASRLSGFEVERLREALRLDFCLWERPVSLPEYLAPEANFLRDRLGSSEEGLEEKGRALRSQLYDSTNRPQIPEASGLDRRQWARASYVQFFAFDLLEEGLNPAQGPSWYLFIYSPKARVIRLEFK